jgi:hypothetical protein
MVVPPRLKRLERLGLLMNVQPIRGMDFVLRSLLSPLINQAKEALMQPRELPMIFGRDV